MLSKEEILVLEEIHGKHNFCYQCGSTNLINLGLSFPFEDFCRCLDCGSDDRRV